MNIIKNNVLIMLIIGLLSVNTLASGNHDGDDICKGFGPQTQRDIDSLLGDNNCIFSIVPSSKDMSLCNIYFHKNAEHKVKAFSIYAGDGDNG